jgi:uncharacterized membrane protein YgcG
MSRVSVIAMMGSAVLAAGVVTGGVLAVTQELDVENHPGEQLSLEGVQTGDAAGGVVLTGARIRAEGTTPKVVETPVVEKPVVNEVEPSDPVRIAPQQPARVAPKPAGPAKKPAPAVKKPAPKPTVSKDKDRWGDWNNWNDRRGKDRDDDRGRGNGNRGGGKGGGGNDGGRGGR